VTAAEIKLYMYNNVFSNARSTRSRATRPWRGELEKANAVIVVLWRHHHEPTTNDQGVDVTRRRI
jgi:hypothetical protein